MNSFTFKNFKIEVPIDGESFEELMQEMKDSGFEVYPVDIKYHNLDEEISEELQFTNIKFISKNCYLITFKIKVLYE